uniref:Uncharacterized protein n=1 Tax=Anguilla anguilla TaxID=7936 RepID=A0A0E9U2E5_ANGAN
MNHFYFKRVLSLL